MKLDVGDAMDLILVDVGERPGDGARLHDQPGGRPADGARPGRRRPGGVGRPSPCRSTSGSTRNGVVQEIVYGGAPREVFEAAVLKVVPDATFTAP